MNTTPPNECRTWAGLEAHALGWQGIHLGQLFRDDPERGAHFAADSPGIRLDYSRQRVREPTLGLLEQLAEERGFTQWRDALLAGGPVNSTENRPAWHTALRAGESAPAEVKTTLQRMKEIAAGIRNGRRFKRIVNLGIGGSDLGPRLVCDALGDGALEPRFAANVDPLELERALAGADPASTLIVVVSKSFSTQETMANAVAARHWLAGAPNLVAVTANEAAARDFGAAEILPMWDWVGGRFSVWSAAGFTAMCALGAQRFDEFLAGAQDVDRHFATAPLGRNVPVLLALIGVWNVNFLGATAHAVLPYAHRLRLLPAYLQQLEMESNGKGVDREGRGIAYATNPVLFGAEGTLSQHSFHQLLHQGTQVVPVDFITIAAAEADSEPQAILAAHALAQAEALAFGRSETTLPPHRQFPGNRPSSTLALERLDARNLGRLLALWEHKVFTQGVIWNVNSFDQWGVELGKQLAHTILQRRK